MEHFVLCQGCGFPAKEMRKAVAGFAGDQPNAMLALSAEERIFLSALILPIVKKFLKERTVTELFL